MGARGDDARTRAYGASEPDGTWREKNLNAFGNLINVARGGREVLQAGAPPLRGREESRARARGDRGDTRAHQRDGARV